MKVWLLSTLLPGFFFTANACSPTDNPVKTEEPIPVPDPIPNPQPTGGRALVVYFSCTNTTKGIAEQIAAVTGSGTHRIEPAVWKPGRRFGGNETGETVRAWIESLDLNLNESNVGVFNLSAGEY